MAINVELKDKLESALEQYGISKAKASRDMGYSDSMLSLYTTGKYTGDVAKLEEAIKKVIAEGVYTPKVVIAVDLFGLPADYEKIRDVSKKYNLYR